MVSRKYIEAEGEKRMEEKPKKKKNATPKKITHIKGDTKIEKKNKEALRIIRAIKGMFG